MTVFDGERRLSRNDVEIAQRSNPQSVTRLKVWGTTLGLAAGAWILLSAAMAGGDPLPHLALIAGCVISFVGSSFIARRWPVAPPSAILMIAVVLALMSGSETVSSAPLSQPLGYANANSAFYALVAAAGLIIASSGNGRIRLIGLAATGVSMAVVVAAGSLTTTLLLGMLVVGFMAHTKVSVRVVIAVGAFLLVTALAVTIFLGSSQGGLQGLRPPSNQAIGALSERRLTLWNEALTLMGQRPLLGVGPGQFASRSPTAMGDRDARWAHNEFLQAGAEMGVPGLLLLISAFGYMCLRLYRSSYHRERGAGVAAAALTSVGVQACVDYTLHFPLIPLTCCVVLGTALSSKPTLSQDLFPARWS